jgi:hypothetical protein
LSVLRGYVLVEVDEDGIVEDTMRIAVHGETAVRISFNPFPSGTLATFFLTAVGPIQHTNEDDIGREKTILMT